jgi:hypothetical protein
MQKHLEAVKCLLRESYTLRNMKDTWISGAYATKEGSGSAVSADTRRLLRPPFRPSSDARFGFP